MSSETQTVSVTRAGITRARQTLAPTAVQARHRYRQLRSWFLVMAALACAVAAVWTAFGLSAGLGSLAVAFVVAEYLGRDDTGGSEGK